MKTIYGVILTIYILLSVVLGGWTCGNIEWVIQQFANKTVNISLWLGVLVNIVLNGFVLAFNVIVEILKLVF